MTRLHYHIKWLPSGKIDWQPFDTSSDAEERAKELVRPEERYVLEPILGDCNTCAAITPQSVNPADPKTNAANG